MSKSILPDGYLPAEFLETSQSGQGIYTNHRSINGQTVEFKGRAIIGAGVFGQINGTSGRNLYIDFGFDYAGSNFFRATSATRLVQFWNGATGFFTNYDRVYFYDDTNYVMTVDGIGASANYSQKRTYADAPLALFGRTFVKQDLTYYIQSHSGTRIFYFKITAPDGALEAHYVPVIDAHGVPCMFDKATQQPVYNVGSGSFLVGISTEQAYALIDKLPVLSTNSNFALTISLPYTAKYDTKLVDALNTTIDLYKVNLKVTYSDAKSARALSIKEAYALPNILPKLTEETAATLAISLPYRAKYDTTLLATLEELATTLYWTITIYYDSPVYPEDFHPAEFIYSDGTAYLDVPVATDFTNKAIKIRTQHLFDATSSGVVYGEGVFSGTNATKLNWSRINTLFGGFAGNSSAILQNPTLYTDKYNTIELEVADNATKLAINGRTATATHTDSTELPELISQIGVFHTYDSTVLLPGKKRFWQLTLDDKVFYNLVPALTWEGVPCMVNTLTNEFYTTAGSADFTIGLSEEQAYTVLPILLTTATTLPSITLPYCARANKKIQALLSEFETTDWVSYSDPVYPDDCIAITSVMKNGTLVDTSGVIPCIIIGDSWTNTIWAYDLNLKEFLTVFPEYVAVISTEELRAIINRLENYISIATANTSFSVQLPYSAQFDTELQTKLIELKAQSGYGVDVAYSNPIDHEDYIPATYLESSGKDSIRLENPEGDYYNEYTGVRAQLAAVEKNEYNYLFYNFNAFESLGLGVSENNVWRVAYSTVTETTAPVELDEQTTIEFNYKDRRQLNIGPAYRQTLSKWDENMGFNSLRLFFPSQFASSNVTGWKLKAWRILFSHRDKVIHDLNPGITYDGIPCFVDVINNITHRVPSYAIGMTVTQLRNLRKLPVTTDGVLNIQFPKYAVLDAEAIAAIEVAEANGWTIQFGYIPVLFLESQSNCAIATDYLPTNNTKIEADLVTLNETYYGRLCGNYGGGSASGMFALHLRLVQDNVNRVAFDFGSARTNMDYLKWNERHTVAFSQEGFYRDGTLIQSIPARTPFVATEPLYVFSVPQSLIGASGCHQIYSFNVFDGEDRVFSFIPWLNENGAPCFFDRVHLKVYENKGSTPFIIGMTTAQARQLRYLPTDAEDKTLTVSLPASIVDGETVTDSAVQAALETAKGNGWTITIRTYTDS